MKNLTGKTALITGASSGIGEAFAYELARLGMHLVITARSENKLEALADAIRLKSNVNVSVIVADLAKPGAPHVLLQKIKALGHSIDLLVNNAGFGKWSNFLDEELVSYEAMITLNITALTQLSYLVLPDMLNKGEGGIINVASNGAFQPCPYITTYCATKAFVLSFSEGLYGEYCNKGVTITALCPGNTETGFQSVAKANTKDMRADTPTTVARQGIKSFLKGKNYTVVGVDNYITSLLPRLLTRKGTIKLVSGMMGTKVNKK